MSKVHFAPLSSFLAGAVALIAISRVSPITPAGMGRRTPLPRRREAIGPQNLGGVVASVVRVLNQCRACHVYETYAEGGGPFCEPPWSDNDHRVCVVTSEARGRLDVRGV